MSSYPEQYGFLTTGRLAGKQVVMDKPQKVDRWVFQMRENGEYFAGVIKDYKKSHIISEGKRHRIEHRYPANDREKLGAVQSTSDIFKAKTYPSIDLRLNPVKEALYIDKYFKSIVGRWLRVSFSANVRMVSARRDVVNSFDNENNIYLKERT